MGELNLDGHCEIQIARIMILWIIGNIGLLGFLVPDAVKIAKMHNELDYSLNARVIYTIFTILL